MRNNAKFVLILLIILSIVMGLYEGVLFINDLEPRQGLYGVWGFVYVVLLVLWVSEDSKNFTGIYRPFDYGFLVFIFYIAYVPYYLFKTRGPVIGFFYFFGFILLPNVGWVFTSIGYWLT